MDTAKLVDMANRIGAFFAAMPDRAESLEGIALHIKRFWEPRMRRALDAHLESTGGTGLDTIVLAALRDHRPLWI